VLLAVQDFFSQPSSR